ncbi:FHA domain-containing protein [Sulfurimonas aquatica]|uniref:FHA domain-containing protein n=2 Tax=Sulfurimonas aquatica TaxID=2672570 RepID=A0A975B2M8_9BACT|nr:FHA domain-containing protein [Sulfurimonas aquatica]
MVKECPTCLHINPESYAECDECGTDLVGVDPIEESEVEVTQEQPQEPVDVIQEECAHSNLHGNYCLDCREYVKINEISTGEWSLQFPWGEYKIADYLWIGRIKPAPQDMTKELEKNFKNISRNHAQISVDDGKLYIVDLESTNGTFVNSQRIIPNQKVELTQESTLKLAKDLVIEISLKGVEL